MTTKHRETGGGRERAQRRPEPPNRQTDRQQTDRHDSFFVATEKRDAERERGSKLFDYYFFFASSSLNQNQNNCATPGKENTGGKKKKKRNLKAAMRGKKEMISPAIKRKETIRQRNALAHRQAGREAWQARQSAPRATERGRESGREGDEEP